LIGYVSEATNDTLPVPRGCTANRISKVVQVKQTSGINYCFVTEYILPSTELFRDFTPLADTLARFSRVAKEDASPLAVRCVCEPRKSDKMTIVMLIGESMVQNIMRGLQDFPFAGSVLRAKLIKKSWSSG